MQVEFQSAKLAISLSYTTLKLNLMKFCFLNQSIEDLNLLSGWLIAAYFISISPILTI